MIGEAEGKRDFRRRLFSVSIAVIATTAFLAAAIAAHEVLILAFLSILIAIGLNYPTTWLSKLMPRGLALVLTLLLVAAATAAAGWIAAAKVTEQAEKVSQQMPLARKKAEAWFTQHVNAAGSTAEAKDGSVTGQAVQSAVTKAVPAAIGVVSGFFAAILTLALAAFLVHQPEVFPREIKRLLPREARLEFDALYKKAGEQLRRWLTGVMITMSIMGSLTAIGLLLVGIDAWLFLGLLTFLGTFIPYAGAMASAIPGLMFALAQSPSHFVGALFVYLGVHVTEGYIVDPLIMRRAVAVNPAVLLVWQALAGATMGIGGVVIATPLLVCVQSVVARHLEKRDREDRHSLRSAG